MMLLILNFVINVPKNGAVLLIELYQRLLSPDHSWLKGRFPYGYCRHYPTCSQYTKEALAKYGLVKGLFLGFKRVLKCNPWVEPKVDLLPQK